MAPTRMSPCPPHPRVAPASALAVAGAVAVAGAEGEACRAGSPGGAHPALPAAAESPAPATPAAPPCMPRSASQVLVEPGGPVSTGLGMAPVAAAAVGAVAALAPWLPGLCSAGPPRILLVNDFDRPLIDTSSQATGPVASKLSVFEPVNLRKWSCPPSWPPAPACPYLEPGAPSTARSYSAQPRPALPWARCFVASYCCYCATADWSQPTAGIRLLTGCCY